MIKTYYVIGYKDFTIKLNSYCLEKDLLGKSSRYMVYNSIGQHKIVKANDLVELRDNKPETLTYVKGGWIKKVSGGRMQTSPLQHWVNLNPGPPEYELVVSNEEIIPNLSDFCMNITGNIPKLTYKSDNYIQDTKEDYLTPIITISGGKNIEISGLLLSNPNKQLFDINNNSTVKLTNINISGGHVKSSKKGHSSSLITISGESINVDIYGFKFTDVSGQLFDITNSTVTLNNITISGCEVENSTDKSASSLISYRTVNSKPNFFTSLSSDRPTPVPTPPAPVPTPPAPSESQTLTLTDICINMITYGVRGIIEIDGATHVDISHLIIHNCEGNVVPGDTPDYVPLLPNYKDPISTLWSPLTLLNTTAIIMNSDFSNNNQITTSNSAQAITSYSSSMNIHNTNFTTASYVKNYYISKVSNALNNSISYWDEDSGHHSIPMIRNYDISSNISKQITIKECGWWTTNDLSNINYLYFFVDKQGYIDDQKRTGNSNLTISDCTRNPSFSTKAAGMTIPNINIYSNRYPLNGTSPVKSLYDMIAYSNNDILNTGDFFIGNWYMLPRKPAAPDPLLKFTNTSTLYPTNVYGLNRDVLGYNQEGMELYYIKQAYVPELTGLICVDKTTKASDLKDYSLNTCGSQPRAQSPSTWDSDYAIIYNEKSCRGRCSKPTTTKM